MATHGLGRRGARVVLVAASRTLLDFRRRLLHRGYGDTHRYGPLVPFVTDKLYSAMGPFTVEVDGNPLIGHWRLWLTSDPDKKVLCEGSARDIGNYVAQVCAAVGIATVKP